MAFFSELYMSGVSRNNISAESGIVRVPLFEIFNIITLDPMNVKDRP
jgi:hypothetical protein